MKKIWVYKDEDDILRPLAGMWPREGSMADYVQPEIDKFIKKEGGSVVRAEILEVDE